MSDKYALFDPKTGERLFCPSSGSMENIARLRASICAFLNREGGSATVSTDDIDIRSLDSGAIIGISPHFWKDNVKVEKTVVEEPTIVRRRKRKKAGDKTAIPKKIKTKKKARKKA